MKHGRSTQPNAKYHELVGLFSQVLQFITALPGVLRLILEGLGFLRKTLGDNWYDFTKDSGEAFASLRKAKTKQEKAAVARKIQQLFRRIKIAPVVLLGFLLCLTACAKLGPAVTACVIDGPSKTLQCALPKHPGSKEKTTLEIPFDEADKYICVPPEDLRTVLEFCRQLADKP